MVFLSQDVASIDLRCSRVSDFLAEVLVAGEGGNGKGGSI